MTLSLTFSLCSDPNKIDAYAKEKVEMFTEHLSHEAEVITERLYNKTLMQNITGCLIAKQLLHHFGPKR